MSRGLMELVCASNVVLRGSPDSGGPEGGVTILPAANYRRREIVPAGRNYSDGFSQRRSTKSPLQTPRTGRYP